MVHAPLLILCALAAAVTVGIVGPAAADEADPTQAAQYAGLLAHLAPLGDPAATRYIGVVSSMVNVFPGEPPEPDQIQPGISLLAARRESESAQVVVSAGPEPLAVERVVVTPLRCNKGGTISRSQIEVRLVGYAYLPSNSWRGIARPGLWPDPLLQFRPFVCPPGQARCLWVTVRVPADARPGQYAGTLRLDSDTRTLATVPLRLQVHRFTLPEAPCLHTSYWNEFESAYDPRQDEAILERMVRLFGAYRVSTNVAQRGDVVWYREPDGTISADWSRLRERLEFAVACGFRTLNIGPGLQGNWGDGAILSGVYRGVEAPVTDRATGKGLDPAEAAKVTREARARAFLVPLADWLERRGLLDRAYLQIADEEMEPGNWRAHFQYAAELFRSVEPRLALLSVLGLHPTHQGWFDIASPLFHFHDATAYRMMREGVSLYGPKSFPARVTASSTGGWGGSSFYKYQPVDGYDGCDYTKWIPAEAPTAEKPQWLRFDFERPETIDGLRVEPYGSPEGNAAWVCEGSTDGEQFQPLALTTRGEPPMSWSFTGGPYRAIRLVWTQARRAFVPNDAQPVPPQEPLLVGVREVEFLGAGVPLESTRPRARVRPVTMWEYQIGSNYPSVSIDADPAEARANPWLCWAHEVSGYLNWGAMQLEGVQSPRPRVEDPLVWPDLVGGNGNLIVYPGQEEVLPSLRFARFRDGVDDFDYLTLLAQRRADHPLLAKLRGLGTQAYSSAAAIEGNRQAIAAALVE